MNEELDPYDTNIMIVPKPPRVFTRLLWNIGIILLEM